MQNPEKLETNLFLRTDTNLRHYHHNSHSDHCTNYCIDKYIDHFYSETANNDSMSNTALKLSPLMIVLYKNRNTMIGHPTHSARTENVLTSQLVI